MKIYNLIQHSLAIVAFASLALVTPVSAATDTEQEAAQFIENLAEQTIAILEQGLSDEELELALSKLLEDNVAIARIGRVVAGTYIRRMSPAQRAAYDDMYREWVIASVVSRFKRFADVGWVLKKTYARKKDVIVRTLLSDPQRQTPVNCDWRVRKIKGQFQILDVVVEGASLVATQKSEFTAILKRDGVDGLLAQLQTQIEKQ